MSRSLRRNRRRRWDLVLIGLATCSVAAGAVEENAASSNDIWVPAVAFRPASSATEYFAEAGGLGRVCIKGGSAYFATEVPVEEGAIVDEVAVLLEDTNLNAFGALTLFRAGAQGFEALAVTPPSSGAPGVEVLATRDITKPVIDRQGSAYVLQIVLTGPGVCLHGARVRSRGQ